MVVVKLHLQQKQPLVMEHQKAGVGHPLQPNLWVYLGSSRVAHKHNPFSALASTTKQSAKAAKKRPPPHDGDSDGEHKKARRDPDLEQHQKGARKVP